MALENYANDCTERAASPTLEVLLLDPVSEPNAAQKAVRRICLHRHVREVIACCTDIGPHGRQQRTCRGPSARKGVDAVLRSIGPITMESAVRAPDFHAVG